MARMNSMIEMQQRKMMVAHSAKYESEMRKQAIQQHKNEVMRQNYLRKAMVMQSQKE